MTIETFFEKFDLFADAPDAVPKMRELVLELAVRGRLLSSTHPNLSAPSAPFSIPHDWRWIALSEAADCRAAAKVESSSLKGSDWVLDLEDIDGGAGKIIATATFAERGSLSTKASFQKGDVLYGKLRPYLNKVVIAERPGFCTTEIIPLRPQAFVAAGYLRLFLRSPHFLRYAAAKNYGMKMPRLGTKDLESAEIPLPLLPEQKQIVAKVDELMSLCDRLEVQQQERETRHAALARASLARFGEAPTPINLQFLFHASYTISPADLRKSILTLAVQGKLVPQDPNDEPAEVFLDRTNARHAQSSNGFKSRKHKPAGVISDEEIPFAIPGSWTWCRLETIADKVTDGEHLSPVKTTSGMPLLTATHVTQKGVTLSNPQYVSVEDGNKSRQRCDPTRGDILICSRGTIGRCAVVETDEVFCLMGSVILVRFPTESAPRYFNNFLSTDLAQTEMRGMSGATAVQALYLKDIRQALIAVPPIAEQRRIVAKVDELMALVDALETQLATSRSTAEKLLAAAVAELTSARLESPTEQPLLAAESAAPYARDAKIIDLRSSPEFIRAVFAAEIIHRLHENSTFGQTKFQKIVYLAEYIAELPEIDSRPARFPRGPHDPQLIEEMETKLKSQDWFKRVPRTHSPGHHYLPLAQAGEHLSDFEKLWPKKSTTIRRLIDEMKTWKTERCERFATLYAAWNDLIIWDKPATDAAILSEVLEHWHSDKLNIPKSSWTEMLQWMKREGYTPKGFGHATKGAPQDELFSS